MLLSDSNEWWISPWRGPSPFLRIWTCFLVIASNRFTSLHETVYGHSVCFIILVINVFCVKCEMSDNNIARLIGLWFWFANPASAVLYHLCCANCVILQVHSLLEVFEINGNWLIWNPSSLHPRCPLNIDWSWVAHQENKKKQK